MLPDISSNSDRRRQYDSQSKIDKKKFTESMDTVIKKCTAAKKGHQI